MEGGIARLKTENAVSGFSSAGVDKGVGTECEAWMAFEKDRSRSKSR